MADPVSRALQSGRSPLMKVLIFAAMMASAPLPVITVAGPM